MKSRTILLFSLLLPVSALFAQELDVTVSVKSDALNSSQRDYIADFEGKVRDYMNTFRWTDVDFRNDKIPVSMEIFLTSATDAGDFTAQVVVASYRRIWEDDRPTDRTSLLLRVNDPKWSFNYIKGSPLYHNDFQFNAITSFLDFYANLALGLDFDSYEPLQGSTYYQKALVISQRAQATSYASEWSGDANKYSRANVLSELTNAQYEPFRNALFRYFYEGLDYLKSEQQDAQKSIAEAFNMISEVLVRTNARSLLLNMFLDSRHDELCTLLDGYPNRPAVAKNMMQADPARSEYYRKCSF